MSHILFLHLTINLSTAAKRIIIQAHLPCVFKKKTQEFQVTYLCEENKSIKLQAFSWVVKLSSSLLRYVIHFKMSKFGHYGKVDFKWKYTHQTYTLLRLCLIIKIPSWLARSIQTKSEWQGLYRNCVILHSSLPEIVSLVETFFFLEYYTQGAKLNATNY